MTILSLINADGSGKDLDITQLRTEVLALIDRDIVNLLPASHSSADYYGNSTQGGLLAFLSLLRARLGQPVRLEEYIGPVAPLSDTKKKQLLDITHRDYTQDGVAWTATNFPVFEDQPEIEAVINEYSIFMDFLDEGARAGATLLNSDFPAEVAAVEEATPVEPTIEPIEPVAVPVETVEPTVEDGIPEEALVPVEAS